MSKDLIDSPSQQTQTASEVLNKDEDMLEVERGAESWHDADDKLEPKRRRSSRLRELNELTTSKGPRRPANASKKVPVKQPAKPGVFSQSKESKTAQEAKPGKENRPKGKKIRHRRQTPPKSLIIEGRSMKHPQVPELKKLLQGARGFVMINRSGFHIKRMPWDSLSLMTNKLPKSIFLMKLASLQSPDGLFSVTLILKEQAGSILARSRKGHGKAVRPKPRDRTQEQQGADSKKVTKEHTTKPEGSKTPRTTPKVEKRTASKTPQKQGSSKSRSRSTKRTPKPKTPPKKATTQETPQKNPKSASGTKGK